MLPEPLDTTIAHKMVNLMPELSGIDKRVAGTILDHYNRKTGQCDPGLGRIAWLVGVSRRTVIRSVSNILTTGILEKARHGGYSQRNSYQPVWSRFRELEAEWKARFSAKSRRAARANVAPSRCQTSDPRGDEAVTQTFLTNPSNNLHGEPLAIGAKSQEKPNKPTSRKEHSGQDVRHVGRLTPSAIGSRAIDAARTAAERRWSTALHNQYAAKPAAYGEVIGAIDPAMQAAATEAEMKRPGAGLPYILNELRMQSVGASAFAGDAADISGSQRTTGHLREETAADHETST